MGFIQHYKDYEIWESDRPGAACKGAKKSTSIQVRQYKGLAEGYLLSKQISFKLGVGENERRKKAIEKAKKYIDKNEIIKL